MGVVQLFKTIKDIVSLVPALLDKPPEDDDIASIALLYEKNAAQIGDKPFLTFEERTVTWGEFNALANQYAVFFREQGISAKDCVALFMENRIEFLACMVALSKLGAIAALINTNIVGKSLLHCIRSVSAVACVVGEELLTPFDSVRDEIDCPNDKVFYVADLGEVSCPSYMLNLGELAAKNPTENLLSSTQVRAKDVALYIFTSGTTGLPKAGIMSHQRYIRAARFAWKVGFRCTQADCVYICLPLYHGTGLVIGLGSVLCSGASVFLRRKFSVSNFVGDIVDNQVTSFVYIGELCRYLLKIDPNSFTVDTFPLKTVIGNGLRPDIWMQFKELFGISRVIEFYAASEGNVGFLNALNKDKTIGMTSHPVSLVQFHLDSGLPRRNEEGYCEEAIDGEPGLLLGEIRPDAKFEGYTDPKATESKILTDVFSKGDRWFNYGDVLRVIDVGFTFGLKHYQFVDRLGDTFRWRSENVSTNEVESFINEFSQVELSVVYGVSIPNTDGKAGMASIKLQESSVSLDVEAFSKHVSEVLPQYARPVFVRILQDVTLTGTFKLVKTELVVEGYDLSKSNDVLYVWKPNGTQYEPLTQDYYDLLLAGNAGY